MWRQQEEVRGLPGGGGGGGGAMVKGPTACIFKWAPNGFRG